MEYFDTDGATPIGFDVDVANAVADYLGLELELVDTAWDGIFAGVDTEKYDCIISCVSITDERKEQFNLTTPYVSNHTVLIVPNESEIDSMEALNGHSTAVQAETTSDDYMKDYEIEKQKLINKEKQKLVLYVFISSFGITITTMYSTFLQKKMLVKHIMYQEKEELLWNRM